MRLFSRLLLGLNLLLMPAVLMASEENNNAAKAAINQSAQQPSEDSAAEEGANEGAEESSQDSSQQPPSQPEEQQNLSDQVADLKQQLINLNRDLFILEEDLLFPATTQLGVFVSMDVGQYFALDSVELRINNQKVSSYLYTPKEVKALYRGGVQRYYMGNLKAGKHQLTAFFIGYGPKGREYKRAATLEIEKDENPLSIELKIVDSEAKNQPLFKVKQW